MLFYSLAKAWPLKRTSVSVWQLIWLKVVHVNGTPQSASLVQIYYTISQHSATNSSDTLALAMSKVKLCARSICYFKPVQLPCMLPVIKNYLCTLTGPT